MKKRLLFVAAVVAMSVAPKTISAANDQSGECGKNGDNITWEYKSATKTLYLYGSGEMTDAQQGYRHLMYDVQKISFSPDITYIGRMGFSNFEAITSVELPPACEGLGYGVFHYCTNLKTITLSENLMPEEVGEAVFSYNYALEEFRLGGNTQFAVEDGVLYTGSKWMLMAYPAGKQATEFEVPEGVTAINDYAFHSLRHLQKLTLPSTLQNIYGNAFGGEETSLTDIYVNATSVPKVSNDYLGMTAAQQGEITLHVPYRLLEQYRSAYAWKNFNIVAEGGYGLTVAGVAVTQENKDYIQELLADYIVKGKISFAETKEVDGGFGLTIHNCLTLENCTIRYNAGTVLDAMLNDDQSITLNLIGENMIDASGYDGTAVSVTRLGSETNSLQKWGYGSLTIKSGGTGVFIGDGCSFWFLMGKLTIEASGDGILGEDITSSYVYITNLADIQGEGTAVRGLKEFKYSDDLEVEKGVEWSASRHAFVLSDDNTQYAKRVRLIKKQTKLLTIGDEDVMVDPDLTEGDITSKYLESGTIHYEKVVDQHYELTLHEAHLTGGIQMDYLNTLYVDGDCQIICHDEAGIMVEGGRTFIIQNSTRKGGRLLVKTDHEDGIALKFMGWQADMIDIEAVNVNNLPMKSDAQLQVELDGTVYGIFLENGSAWNTTEVQLVDMGGALYVRVAGGESVVPEELYEGEIRPKTTFSLLSYNGIELMDEGYKNDRYFVEYHSKTTGLEEVLQDVENTTKNVQKVLIDGVLYIIKDGKAYNALGAEIK